MKERLIAEIKLNIQLYKKAKSLSLKNYYYNSICCLIDVYQDLTNEVYPFYPHIIDIIYNNHCQKNKYKSLFNELSKQSYRDMINHLSSNGIRVIEDNIELEEEKFYTHIDYKNACDIIYSFFEKYDKNLLPFVKQILKDNVVFCSSELEKLGYSNNIQSLNKSYIVLFTDKDKINIEILITLIHEIGHVLYNRTLDSKQKTFNYNNFIEVLPYFFEQVFIEFCIKNNIYSLECLKAQKNDIIGLYNYLTDLYIVNRFIKKINLKTLSVTLHSDELSQIDGYDFANDCLIFDECDLNYLYTYGMLLGFYYSESHKNNSDITKQNIKEFILDTGSYKDQFILSHYGIDYDKLISCEFLEPIIKENQKRLNKTTQF